MSVNKDQLRRYGQHYDRKRLEDLAKSMNRKLGDMAPVIAMEELSELVQATTKWLRFDRNPESNRERYRDDKLNICEEIADATIALHIIKHMAGVSGGDINQMIAYKIERDFGLLNQNKMVKGKKNL